MSAPSEADVIAGEFPTITLIDGSQLVLRASLANTRIIEQRYGSLGGLFKVFNSVQAKAGESADDYMNRQLFTPIIDIMACLMPRGPLRDAEELAEQLDGRRFTEYVEALGKTLQLAFPAAKTEPAQDGPGNVPALDPERMALAEQTWTAAAPPPLPDSAYPTGSVPLAPWAPQTNQTDPFPGRPSGTERPSSWDAPTTSSGG